MDTTAKRRRPGRPREREAPETLTIRLTPRLYQELEEELARTAHLGSKRETQRALIEVSVTRELNRRARVRKDKGRKR